MRIHRPRIEVEFFQDPEPRSNYIVLSLDGSEVICDSPEDALALLVTEVGKYIEAMHLVPLQGSE